MIKTLKQAINNDQLLSWPVIDKLNFGKYIVDTKAIHMGHLDEERQYLQSTKQQSAKKPSHKALEIINTIIPFDAKSMACGNLTGPFPYTSLRGAKYLFILYDYDANTIFAHTIKSKQVHEIKQAWLATTKRLEKHGHILKHFILDNEYPNDLKQAIRKQNMTFQLVPPHNHRQNAVERAIKTFKAHFLSTLATCDPEYPITEWDRLIPQS